MVAYLGLRLLVDFFKPYPAVFLGLGVLQWACVATHRLLRARHLAVGWSPRHACGAAAGV